MPSSAQSHARSHALLLLQKLLNLRDSASPLTLILDTLEQSARPLVREFLSRAKASKAKIIFLSYATLKKPADVDIFIKAWAGRNKTPEALRAEIASHYPSGGAGHAHKVVVVIDLLNALAAAASSSLAMLLSSLVTPAVSLVGVYHTDVPLVLPRSFNEYEPHPLTTLCHLATAILRVGSLYQAVERQKARNRSLQEPEWGLNEGREGVLIGLGGEKKVAAGEGLVLEMELRRRSGRSVAEKFVLVPRTVQDGKFQASKLFLLSDHPAFRDPGDADQEGTGVGDGEMETTFNLGLTEKQRRDREGIVLPYFDAQTDIGAGEGGRILYEMGREDDFDDEEDEI
ncbi:histone acetylation protein 2 [Hypomontagnella submonticulosa]|nr:histone acetylation protein 2 [Hypomontagnella submonticulosa]